MSGEGGAPLYAYGGELNLSAYLDRTAADSVEATHLVRPSPKRSDNPYHYVVVHVNGRELWMEVAGVDWGRGFQPYGSARTTLSDLS